MLVIPMKKRSARLVVKYMLDPRQCKSQPSSGLRRAKSLADHPKPAAEGRQGAVTRCSLEGMWVQALWCRLSGNEFLRTRSRCY